MVHVIYAGAYCNEAVKLISSILNESLFHELSNIAIIVISIT